MPHFTSRPKKPELDFSPVDGHHNVTFIDEPYPHAKNPAKYGMCVAAICKCGTKDPKTGKTTTETKWEESLNNGGLAGAKMAVRRKAFEHLEAARKAKQ